MRIALCSDIFLPHMGGIENVIKCLAEVYMEMGHDVMIFTSTMNIKHIDDSIFTFKVVRTESKTVIPGVHNTYPKKDKAFNKAFDEFKPDVVHSHTPFSIGMWGIEKAKEIGVPSVLTTHTYLSYMNDTQVPFSKNNPIHKAIVKSLNNQPRRASAAATVLTAVSNNTIREEIRRAYGLERETHLVRNGFDFKKNCQSAIENYINDHDKDAFRLFYAGQIDRTKNIQFSLKVCKELKRRCIPFVFNLAGEVNKKFHLPFQKNDKEKYIEAINKYGISDSVHFLGRLNFDGLQSNYSRSDAFLFPSEYDTDGLVVKEASMCGCPALIIKDTGASEQVDDGVNGFTLLNSVDAFADKIEELYNLKRDHFDEFIALRSRTQAKKLPSWNEIAMQYLALYQA